jgi:3'-5' exoribonuclease
MKSQYVGELKAGQSVKETFVLTKKIVKDKKDGGLYAILEFSDRTGSIDGISWDGDDLNEISADDFVFVTGNVTEYSGRLQIVVDAIHLVDEADIDAEDFLPRYAGDIDEVMKEVSDYAVGVKNAHLRALLDSFFEDKDFVKLFSSAPAARRVHHAYLGGLAVHTLSVLNLLESMRSVFGFLNRDLLITGGILHDVGKIYEYAYKKSISISDRGRLLGHIVIGSEMVSERAGRLKGFPDDLKSRIIHMILSHHGEIAWGSPKQPLFPEALVLHYADNLDSKMEMIKQVYAKHRGQNKQWSDYHPFLEREIYLGDDS